MVNNEATEEFVKELDLTEEEIESYTGCSERTQRCLDVYKRQVFLWNFTTRRIYQTEIPLSMGII